MRRVSSSLSDRFPPQPEDGLVYDQIGHNQLEAIRRRATRYQMLSVAGFFMIFGGMADIILRGIPPIYLPSDNHFVSADMQNAWPIELSAGGLVLLLGSGLISWLISRSYRTRLVEHRRETARAKRADIESQSRGQEGIMDEIRRAQMKGDIIVSGSGHTVLVNSQVVNSFNAVKGRDPDLAKAITTLAGLVEISKNADAADLFNSFHEEISSPKPKKKLLNSLWTGLTLALPVIKEMTDIVGSITPYFKG